MKLKNQHEFSPKRIFIDASFTLGSGKSSGVERVVRNLTRQIGNFSSDGLLPKVESVVCHSEQFYLVDQATEQRYHASAKMHRDVLSCLPSFYRPVASAVCGLLPNRTLRKWLLPESGHLGAFKLAHLAKERIMHWQVANRASPVQPQPGDLFILPDAYWVNRLQSTVWPAAESARAAGAKVATLLYDLIPLSHPQFVGAERSRAFLDYLLCVASNSDMIVAISETVCKQAREFLGEIEPSTHSDSADAHDPREFCEDLRSFELGCEINVDRCGDVRNHVRQAFATGDTPYLMVSTFDPRKNHGFLLDAFDQLWADGGTQRLVLVGRLGAKCDGTIERIQNHRLFGKQLFLFTDLSDAELQYTYEHARGVVFPSVVEGFGLPIVESLSFGKRTIASDTSIHREVGRDDCVYFDLSSPRNLAREVLAWDRAVKAGEDKLEIDRQLTTWRESAEQFMGHCLDLFSEPTRQSSSKRAA
ncbi:MAG: glycosyltransferase family 1 protein [Aureliella sp.]